VSGQNCKLPTGWTRLRFGDVVTLKRGFDLPTKSRQPGPVPVYAANGPVGTHNKSAIKAPGVVTGRSGTIGKVHYIEEDFWPLNTALFVEDFHGNDPKFVVWLLRNIDLKQFSSSTAVPTLNRNNVHKSEVNLPPLAEQQRIVAKIDALQERSRRAREVVAEVRPLLEQFRQSVLVAAFRGDLTANWRAAHPNVEPASELLHCIRIERRHRWEQAELAKYEAKGQKPPQNWQDKYEAPEPVDDAELPGLPDSWCWVSLDDLLNEPLANGRSVKDGNGFPVLRLTALKNRRIDLSECKLGDWNTTDARRFTVQKGDFLVSRGNGSIDLVGRGGLVVDEPYGQVAYPDTLIRVRVTQRFNRNLLALLWDSAIVRQKIELAAHTTAGIHKISQSDLQQIPLPLPPFEEQQAIVLRAIAYLKGIERLSSEASKVLEAFDQLDQSILTKAFRGELVPQDSNDEPASALLARIREQRMQQAEAAKHKQKTATTQRGNQRSEESSRPTPQQLTLPEMLLPKG
jgi:type I restriction enzyme S subunit